MGRFFPLKKSKKMCNSKFLEECGRKVYCAVAGRNLRSATLIRGRRSEARFEDVLLHDVSSGRTAGVFFAGTVFD